MDIELAQALAENELLKSMLYCTKRSCNNCGKVNCENFQRQRIDCCGNWVSYKDYIRQLEEEKDKAWWERFDTCKAKAGEANVKLSDEINLLKAQIEKLIDFVLSKTECCDVCPITDTCLNGEGTCPYAGILKGEGNEEKVTREWIEQFIKDLKK